MFFPKAMSEIELIVPSKDLMKVMRVLGGRGVFHQVDSASIASEPRSAQDTTWQDRASGYAALDRRLQSILQTLGLEQSSIGPPVANDLSEMDDLTRRVESVEKKVKEAAESLLATRKQRERLLADRRQLEPVADIDLDMGAFRGMRFVLPILGSMPAANLSRLQTSLSRVPHLLLTLREDAQRPVVWLAGTRSNQDVLQRAARSAYLEPLELPEGLDGTPQQLMDRLDQQIAESESAIHKQEDTISQLRDQHRGELLKLAGEIHVSRILADAIGRFGRLRHTYVVLGWVPTENLESLMARLREISREILMETVPASRHGDRRNVPVALGRSRLLRPFQMLVTTYARPKYGEIDPTWLIAVTFPLLFGAMFGDVGHGLVLAAVGALIASGKVRMLKSMSNLGGLILVCGLLGAVFGFLYGSLFGFEDILPAIWMQPLHNILSILIVSVAAGIFLLVVGFLIGIFNAWVSRDWAHLIFGHTGIAGLALYVSLLGLGATLGGLIRLPDIVFGALALVAGLAVMFSEIFIRLMQRERPLMEGGLATYAIQAPVELFEAVISLLSNSLSYVRVGAFAVAHGGLSSAIFILAALVGPETSVGYWIVVVLGNLFIVGFEGLIVGIQTMRLSYYEFFSKFFTGGGMRFDPISLAPAKDE